MASRVRADGLLDELDAIGEQMSRALGLRPATTGGARGWLPPVDIWETGDELVIDTPPSEALATITLHR